MPAPLPVLLARLPVIAALLGAAGCTGPNQASAAGVSRDDLLTELAGQLATSATTTYTATYQLAGGGQAEIVQAQRPTRRAYAYRGVRLIVTPSGTVHCARQTCTETDPDSAAAPADSAVITPEAVLAMLNAAALDADVTVEQRDTTIAGRHAMCLHLGRVDGTPARDFAVCVTSEGALGSFTAVIDGSAADVALTAYADTADPAAFRVPADAALIDRRTGRR